MKLIRSFGFALTGIKSALLSQQNLRIHFLGLSGVCAAAWYLAISPTDWCLLLLASGGVIAMELLNTALENLTDLVTREQHPLAAKAKDMAAGAVLFSCLTAVVVGVIVFSKYI